MAAIDLRPLPPAAAVRYFREKGYRLGFDWRDVWQEEHARAFTVAKAMRYDILADIRAELDRAISEGTTAAEFRKRLTPVLQAKGWWGRARMTDPKTGRPRTVQLGSPRRLGIIFDTNLRMAHAAGRWEKIQRLKKRRPFLRYSAVLDDRTRPEHRAWHGTVLPADHPFWESHYPPNGWRCRCIVQQLSERDLERHGFKVDAVPPPTRTRAWRNRRTGETTRVPEGIDPGFGYNVGKAHLRGLVPPPLPGAPAPGPVPAAPLPPLPAARPARSELLPEGMSDEAAAARFLGRFGAGVGAPRVFTDAAGEPLVIGEDLFRDSAGAWKLGKGGRRRRLLLLADTIADPDEIWVGFAPAGQDVPMPRLRRRYVARWVLGEEEVPALVVFEVDKDGWRGTTAFTRLGRNPTQRARYIDRQRIGTRVWRRKE